jgi:hypothetical protein
MSLIWCLLVHSAPARRPRELAKHNRLPDGRPLHATTNFDGLRSIGTIAVA